MSCFGHAVLQAGSLDSAESSTWPPSRRVTLRYQELLLFRQAMGNVNNSGHTMKLDSMRVNRTCSCRPFTASQL